LKGEDDVETKKSERQMFKIGKNETSTLLNDNP